MKFTFTITAITNTSALRAGESRRMSAYVDPCTFETDDFGDARDTDTAMRFAINEAVSRIVRRIYGRNSYLGVQSQILYTNKYGTHVDGRVNLCAN